MPEFSSCHNYICVLVCKYNVLESYKADLNDCSTDPFRKVKIVNDHPGRPFWLFFFRCIYQRPVQLILWLVLSWMVEHILWLLSSSIL